MKLAIGNVTITDIFFLNMSVFFLISEKYNIGLFTENVDDG